MLDHNARHMITILAVILTAACTSTPARPAPSTVSYNRGISLLAQGELQLAAEELAQQLSHDAAPPKAAFCVLALIGSDPLERDRYARGALSQHGAAGVDALVWHGSLCHAARSGGSADHASSRMRRLIRKHLKANLAELHTPSERLSMQDALEFADEGLAALDRGDLTRAMANCGAALKLRPHSPYITLAVSEALRRYGDCDGAQRFLEVSLRAILPKDDWHDAIVNTHLAVLAQACQE
ncbi:MAG: hypothetical protein HQ592_00285 [Planctomycetes bacterium]|nr:hypothetical protein [Planctomycetota bacterium]